MKVIQQKDKYIELLEKEYGLTLREIDIIVEFKGLTTKEIYNFLTKEDPNKNKTIAYQTLIIDKFGLDNYHKLYCLYENSSKIFHEIYVYYESGEVFDELVEKETWNLLSEKFGYTKKDQDELESIFENINITIIYGIMKFWEELNKSVEEEKNKIKNKVISEKEIKEFKIKSKITEKSLRIIKTKFRINDDYLATTIYRTYPANIKPYIMQKLEEEQNNKTDENKTTNQRKKKKEDMDEKKPKQTGVKFIDIPEDTESSPVDSDQYMNENDEFTRSPSINESQRIKSNPISQEELNFKNKLVNETNIDTATAYKQQFGTYKAAYEEYRKIIDNYNQRKKQNKDGQAIDVDLPEGDKEEYIMFEDEYYVNDKQIGYPLQRFFDWNIGDDEKRKDYNTLKKFINENISIDLKNPIKRIRMEVKEGGVSKNQKTLLHPTIYNLNMRKNIGNLVLTKEQLKEYEEIDNPNNCAKFIRDLEILTLKDIYSVYDDDNRKESQVAKKLRRIKECRKWNNLRKLLEIQIAQMNPNKPDDIKNFLNKIIQEYCRVNRERRVTASELRRKITGIQKYLRDTNTAEEAQKIEQTFPFTLDDIDNYVEFNISPKIGIKDNDIKKLNERIVDDKDKPKDVKEIIDIVYKRGRNVWEKYEDKTKRKISTAEVVMIMLLIFTQSVNCQGISLDNNYGLNETELDYKYIVTTRDEIKKIQEICLVVGCSNEFEEYGIVEYKVIEQQGVGLCGREFLAIEKMRQSTIRLEKEINKQNEMLNELAVKLNIELIHKCNYSNVGEKEDQTCYFITGEEECIFNGNKIYREELPTVKCVKGILVGEEELNSTLSEESLEVTETISTGEIVLIILTFLSIVIHTLLTLVILITILFKAINGCIRRRRVARKLEDRTNPKNSYIRAYDEEL